MIIKRSKKFIKAFQKCPKHIQLKVIERLDLFLTDSCNPILNIHNLQGKLNNISSFNVTGDYRVWFSKDNESGKLIILLLTVGTHSQLY